MHYNILSRRRRANRPTEQNKSTRARSNFRLPIPYNAPETYHISHHYHRDFPSKISILPFKGPPLCISFLWMRISQKTKKNRKRTPSTDLLNIINIFLSNCDYQKSDEWKLVFVFGWNWFLEAPLPLTCPRIELHTHTLTKTGS